MTRVAGAVSDGLLCHGFTTEAYLRDVTIPTLEQGLAGAGRSRGAVEVSLPAMCAIATHDDAPAIAAARSTISFYRSAPAYRPVLEHHGWAALGEELHSPSRQRRWDEMGGLVDDDVLHTFYAVGTVDEVAAMLLTRFGDVVDRLQVVVGEHDVAEHGLVAALRAKF
jgi:alkanesulfonate monooxygenase SsuD/methylene tetrahydromethanopterin reductase-like flavin-dependent oxidoreductase (luciferase family)